MMFSDITTAGVKCTITLLQKSKNIIDDIITAIDLLIGIIHKHEPF